MPQAAIMPIAGAAMGGTGGAIAGARGSRQYTEVSTPEAGPEERQLQQRAIEQYLQSIGLIGQQEQAATSLDPFRNQALQGLQNVMSGQAFQSTPEEMANIEALRQAQVNLGTQDIGRLLGQNLTRTAGSAGVRGLRGQALSTLQGKNMELAGREIGNVVNTAGLQAAQQQMENPYRRVAAQSPVMQMGLTYQDQLRQNAFQNRQLASNPALLGYFQQGRGMNARTTQVVPGGGFWGAVQGNQMGSMAGLGAGMSAMGGMSGMMGG